MEKPLSPDKHNVFASVVSISIFEECRIQESESREAFAEHGILILYCGRRNLEIQGLSMHLADSVLLDQVIRCNIGKHGEKN